MNIYEIDQAITACVDETGEVIDLEQLMALQMEKEQKLENIACWIKELTALTAAIKSEEAKLKARREAAEVKVERLKDFLSDILQGEKMVTSRVQIGFRKSVSLQIDDGTQIPQEYLREKVSIDVDKAGIKDALKSGNQIPGCWLMEKQNIQIK